MRIAGLPPAHLRRQQPLRCIATSIFPVQAHIQRTLHCARHRIAGGGTTHIYRRYSAEGCTSQYVLPSSGTQQHAHPPPQHHWKSPTSSTPSTSHSRKLSLARLWTSNTPSTKSSTVPRTVASSMWNTTWRALPFMAQSIGRPYLMHAWVALPGPTGRACGPRRNGCCRYVLFFQTAHRFRVVAYGTHNTTCVHHHLCVLFAHPLLASCADTTPPTYRPMR